MVAEGRLSLPHSLLSIAFACAGTPYVDCPSVWYRNAKGQLMSWTRNPIWISSGGSFSSAMYHLVLSWDHQMSVLGKICHKWHSEVAQLC